MALDAAALAALSSLLADTEQETENHADLENEHGGQHNDRDLDEAVIEALAEELKLEANQIDPAQNLEKDLKLNLLGRLAVMAQVEEENPLQGNDEAVLQAQTVAELIQAFQPKTQ